MIITSGVQIRMKSEAVCFLSGSCRKTQASAVYWPDRIRFCRTRSDTEIIDEARFSAPSYCPISFNTISILEIFDIKRARSTVHSWVHKADLQPEAGRSPGHIAVDEAVIRLNDEQYWLNAAVDPETNKLRHTKLEPATTKVLAYSFLTKVSEKHDVSDAVFLVDGSHSLQDACQRCGFDFLIQKDKSERCWTHL